MRILIFLAVAVISAYLGYKIAEITIHNRRIANNIQPVIDELRIQLSAIQDKLSKLSLSDEDKIELEKQKSRILDLIGKFYGYSIEEMNNLLNTK